MLLQNVASVRANNVQPARHVIGIDWARTGVVKMVNSLCEAVDTEWILPLADDDLLMKNYIQEMVAAAAPAVDVIYSRPAVVGSDWAPYRYEFSAHALREQNFIPSTALIRTDLWRKLGGYSEHAFPEDWDFWLRALDAGAFFRHVPSVNWIYRQGDHQLFNRHTRPGAGVEAPEPAVSGERTEG